MGETDFSRLQAVLVNNVLLACEDKPDGFVVEWRILVIRVIVANESFLCGVLLLLRLVGLDMAQQRGRSFLDLEFALARVQNGFDKL